MYRCLQLALMGQGRVAPNPMVGAVLVHNDRIIGEGWHRQFGGPHAEVNCVDSVQDRDQHLVREATLYVSLEPCAHYGKTPPCAQLVIDHRIPRVVVGCRDPFPLVAGKGIEKLEAAGVEVTVGVLERDCQELNKRFFLFHTEHRPYVTLKWAQTGDSKMALPPAAAPGSHTDAAFTGQGQQPERLLISGAAANRLVHRWRSEETAILVGTHTALYDDPALTTRLWPGNDPIRLVVDLHGRLPQHLKVFDGTVPTIVFNLAKHTLTDAAALRHIKGGVHYYQVAEDTDLVPQVLHALYHLHIQSVLVEGGARLLQAFIDAGVWDEARIITNEGLYIGKGLPAPQLQQQQLLRMEQLDTDTIRFYKHV